MKFSIGDLILLKRTGEEGHVVSFIDKQMVEVEVAGTTFPVYMDDIDHPYLKWFTDKTPKKKTSTSLPILPQERIIERKQRLARGVYLSFFPVFKTEDMEEVVDYLKVHLLNETPVSIKFYYDIRLSQQSEFKHEGILHEFGNIYLHNVPYVNMNDQPRFHWKLVDAVNTKMETAEGVLRIRPSKLFEQINTIMTSGEPSFSYLLIDEFIVKKKPEEKILPEPLKEYGGVLAITKKTIEPAKYELDLHIEQLVSNHKALNVNEILKKQLDTLEKYLHLAIVHHQERMIVIHGLGKGKLRDEVHNMLKNTPEVGRYKNEWSGKYGFGATEIYFKY